MVSAGCSSSFVEDVFILASAWLDTLSDSASFGRDSEKGATGSGSLAAAG